MGKILSSMHVGILTALGLLCAATFDANPQAAQAAQPAASDFKVTLLGTSTPNPLARRLFGEWWN
jgi:hypothetical protein